MSRLTNRDRVWHAAYCRWYDHRQAGNRRRAAVWGWIADAACALFRASSTGGKEDDNA